MFQSLTDKANVNYYSGTVDDMLSDWTSKGTMTPYVFSVYGETAQFLTNSTSSAVWFGLRIRNGSNNDYMLLSPTGGYIYYGRVASGTLNRLYQVSGTSVSV